MAGCRRINAQQIRELLDRKHCVLFDCDGVLWNGEDPVPGAVQAVSALRRAGKRVLFVTNNSTRLRDSYVCKFTRLGFTGVTSEQVFSSAYCSALYLRDVARLTHGVYVLAGQGVRGELTEADVHCVETEPERPGDTIADCPLEADVKAVLVGYDDTLSFLKLAKACCHLQNPDCLFLGTDADPFHPLRHGRVTPGSGSLIAALETATNRKATVIGKPSRFMFDCMVSQFGVDPSQSLMIGDRLETDILFGVNCGLETMLTLTGVSTLQEAERYRDGKHKHYVPDYVVESVADLLPAME